MESDLREIQTTSLSKETIQPILDSLDNIAKDAINIRDTEYVHDSNLQNALKIVESFLRKRKRVCYGGMAINVHLPPKLKFYDFSKTLPDYDFFTYEADKDIKELISMLHHAGFTDVSPRLGVHAGTMKLFVNYYGIADITEIPKWLYFIIQKKAITEKGILYADANLLRMNMYLELSRPRGEVERWNKVYQRLLLLNLAKEPSPSCKPIKQPIRLNKQLHELLIQYIIDNNLIFAGAELKRIYSKPTTKRVGYVLKSQSPVLAYAENPAFHVPVIEQLIQTYEPSGTVKVVHWASIGNGFPELWGIQLNGQLVFVCLKEEFCYSYNTVQLPNSSSMYIVSLDTAITLFYMLTYLHGLEGIVPTNLLCFADSLVTISKNTRDKGSPGVYPLFVAQCHGHQALKTSLLRAKAERIKSLKRKVKYVKHHRFSKTKKHRT